eukprot:Gregarina_sp_Poly_1__8574@NODE_508_length_7840_cov_67_044127_g406_i0_p3_GENE_NODE_508_length_7840_cov_67_044127_g406_i0NODE_508_length_7840_cov_67_044127_g406_i0_p3_ORF_typecomplete_len358_score31_19DNA_methylase/PF00145_17/5_6e41Met_10/PF02475_16/0_073_NODE_508_length_7840_cov_67_044127_g406_i029974070
MRQLGSLREVRRIIEQGRHTPVLDFFSGIGGFKHALKLAGLGQRIHVAFEINPHANCFYTESSLQDHQDTSLFYILNKDICSLSCEWFNSLPTFEIWTLSPPCQPYSIQGSQKGSMDRRSGALQHLTQVLVTISDHKLPRLLILENVAPFANFDSWRILCQTLESRNFKIHSREMCPSEFGWPNKRNRFYCAAARFEQPVPTPQIWCSQATLRDLLDAALNSEESEFLVPPEVLAHPRSRCLDIVDYRDAETAVSMCFTKAYGRYLNGTGSVLQFQGPRPGDANYEFPSSIMRGCVRFFSPREVCALMGFSSGLPLPPHLSRRCLYALLGNSLNPQVVAHFVRPFIHAGFPGTAQMG